MELVYKQIYEWQNKLCEEVDSMKITKAQRLRQQLDQLNGYHAEINQGKRKYQELIDDPSLDVQYRKKQVVGMVDELLRRPQIPLSLVTQPKLEFGWNEQYLNTLLSHVVINDCDQPFPPHVMVTMIRHSSVVLQVSIITGDLGREVLEFVTEYAVLPKDEDIKLKSDPSPLENESSVRASIVSEQSQPSVPLQKSISIRLSSAAQPQPQPSSSSKKKKKSKKKGDDSSSDESKSDKSDKSSKDDDDDEDKSSKSDSESESESESDDKDSNKSGDSEKSDSEKSSGDSDDTTSDNSGGKKSKKKRGKGKEKKRKRKRKRTIIYTTRIPEIETR